MLETLNKVGYTAPTPVQAGLMPQALTGRDLLGQAQTGTGKTAAFCIPIIERIEHPAKSGRPLAIILVPTRELAVQVRDEAEKLSRGHHCRCTAIYGGKPIRPQVERLKRGAEVVVGTPGRVLDHLGRGTLSLEDVFCVVLDEADRMLDIGFLPDIERILRKAPRDRQTLLLTATAPPAIERLAKRFMREFERLDYSPKHIAVETIEQFYFTVERNRKSDLLVRLIKRDQPRQAIVFCRTKRGAERLYQSLSKKSKKVGVIHGDLRQSARDSVMKAFRTMRIRVLVATDVVGRGIDVTSISHIINYDIPAFSDDYVHRVGRTGRMGREGVAYTFVTSEEGRELTRIEMRIDKQLIRDEMEGFSTVAASPVKTPESLDTPPDVSWEPEPEIGLANPTQPKGPPPEQKKKKYRRAL